ncbi:MAG TPA: response regulator transcription factor [Bryobacteraceae bacterium]|jgi:DNA-binding NarL/FixJ family response regulator|nr:response regulator transcription factor [Bryobacteraceae bacterium]
MIRILCVDDHPVVLDGLSAIIAMQADMEIAATASNGEAGLRAFREHKPDVTIVDLRLPDMSGLDLIKTVRAGDSRAKIIVLSSYDGDADIQRALDAGAQGYVAKGLVRDELLNSIRSVAKGGKHIPDVIAQRLVAHIREDAISEREAQVLRLVAIGKRNKEIAGELSIAEDTVKMHVRNILSKLNASDRTEAVTVALRRGIIHI